MKFKKRKSKVKVQEAEDFELDLAPMLALMVTLIPIMLLSTVFVHVKVIDTPLPQVVQQAIEKDRNDKDRKWSFYLDISAQQGYVLRGVYRGKDKVLAKIPRVGEKWDLEGLHQELIKTKQAHPDVFQLNIKPAEDVPYSDIVAVIDEARSAKSGEAKFQLTDEQGKTVETDVMFPDVIFANVVEG